MGLGTAGCVGKVAGVDGGGVEVLDVGEGGEFEGDLAGGEEELEGLSGLLTRAARESRSSCSREERGGTGEGVVEDQAGAGGLGGEEGEGGAEGGVGEVGDDAQPSEEGGTGGVESGGEQAVGEVLVLEVDGDEGEARGCCDGGADKKVLFPGLGGGVIDLEDV